MRRYYTPMFQAQFKGFHKKPEKQELILDAIDRFQRLQTDADGCSQIYEESEQLFELDAGQGIKIIAGLYPFAEVADLGVFLLVEKEPQTELTVKG